jgi:hypothetical protein
MNAPAENKTSTARHPPWQWSAPSPGARCVRTFACEHQVQGSVPAPEGAVTAGGAPVWLTALEETGGGAPPYRVETYTRAHMVRMRASAVSPGPAPRGVHTHTSVGACAQHPARCTAPPTRLCAPLTWRVTAHRWHPCGDGRASGALLLSRCWPACPAQPRSALPWAAQRPSPAAPACSSLSRPQPSL